MKFFRDMRLRTRLAVDAAIGTVAASMRREQKEPARHLELSELEDRVLFSASPAAAVMPDPGMSEGLDATVESVGFMTSVESAEASSTKKTTRRIANMHSV